MLCLSDFELYSRWIPLNVRPGLDRSNSRLAGHFDRSFLDANRFCNVIKDVIKDGLLTTSVYRKPTHTDQYLAYDSHHPQSVKRGIVKCLYDRAKHLITKPSVISEEKKHLSSVLVSNGYPSSFIRKLAKTTRPTANNEPTQEFKSTAVFPILKVYQRFFAAAYNNKAFAPSLNLTQLFGLT